MNIPDMAFMQLNKEFNFNRMTIFEIRNQYDKILSRYFAIIEKILNDKLKLNQYNKDLQK